MTDKIKQPYEYKVILTREGENINVQYDGFRTGFDGSRWSLKGIYTGDMAVPAEATDLENQGRELLKKSPKSKGLTLILKGEE